MDKQKLSENLNFLEKIYIFDNYIFVSHSQQL